MAHKLIRIKQLFKGVTLNHHGLLWFDVLADATFAPLSKTKMNHRLIKHDKIILANLLEHSLQMKHLSFDMSEETIKDFSPLAHSVGYEPKKLQLSTITYNNIFVDSHWNSDK